MTKLVVGDDELLFIGIPNPTRNEPPGLTRTERALLNALLSGDSNDKIARVRGRSPRTIANQLQTLYRKLGVNSRAEVRVRMLACQPTTQTIHERERSKEK